ncbi:MAG: CD225/dispanin family protein [Bacteroidales bacterium]
MNKEVCPKTWMVESILVTCFCCLPLGIVGIINASKVSSLFAQGNYEEALRASIEAKKWTKIGFIAALVSYILSILIYGGTLFAALSM